MLIYGTNGWASAGDLVSLYLSYRCLSRDKPGGASITKPKMDFALAPGSNFLAPVSSSGHFAAGRLQLAIFNPFPGEDPHQDCQPDRNY